MSEIVAPSSMQLCKNQKRLRTRFIRSRQTSPSVKTEIKPSRNYVSDVVNSAQLYKTVC